MPDDLIRESRGAHVARLARELGAPSLDVPTFAPKENDMSQCASLKATTTHDPAGSVLETPRTISISLVA